MVRPLRERFESFVSISPTGCWDWTGAISAAGYGVFIETGSYRHRRAHRVAWEIYRGAVPRGLELDHLCRNKACVNPEHLEAVTHQENMRRGKHATKTHCEYGHDWTVPGNVYGRKNGGRRCAVCHRERYTHTEGRAVQGALPLFRTRQP